MARGGDDQPLTNAVFCERSAMRTIADKKYRRLGKSPIESQMGIRVWLYLFVANRSSFAALIDAACDALRVCDRGRFKSEKSVFHHRNSTTTTPLSAR